MTADCRLDMSSKTRRSAAPIRVVTVVQHVPGAAVDGPAGADWSRRPPGRDQRPGPMVAITHRLALSERLRARRFELLPVDADVAAPTTSPQARDPGDSTAPADLVELISSIASVGLLQPLLVEHVEGRHRLVAGERRLRALRWGRVHLPDHPNFWSAPAVVCPGPLTEEERRVWQLVENLAREDLQPGELAAALLYERCAVLAAHLAGGGHDIPQAIVAVEDPVRRWAMLDRHRRDVGAHHLGAPWEMVLSRIGVQLSADKAKAVVRAFRALPRELSWEMDAHGVALASRLEFLRLERGRHDAADAIWAAVRTRDAARLLTGAVHAVLADPDLDAEGAIAVAEAVHADANVARSTALAAAGDLPPADDGGDAVGDDLVESVVEAIGDVLIALRRGGRLAGFAAGTLRLQLRELAAFLEPGDAA